MVSASIRVFCELLMLRVASGILPAMFFNFSHVKCLFIFSPLWSGKNENKVRLTIFINLSLFCIDDIMLLLFVIFSDQRG